MSVQEPFDVPEKEKVIITVYGKSENQIGIGIVVDKEFIRNILLTARTMRRTMIRQLYSHDRWDEQEPIIDDFIKKIELLSAYIENPDETLIKMSNETK